ncbi:hypothetical protein Tco_1303324, partial [Tanacetum coccineum]
MPLILSLPLLMACDDSDWCGVDGMAAQNTGSRSTQIEGLLADTESERYDLERLERDYNKQTHLSCE